MAGEAHNDVLHSILADLRDLKASHRVLEHRLESLAISPSSRSNIHHYSDQDASVHSGLLNSIGNVSQPIPIRPGEISNASGYSNAYSPSPPVPSQFAASPPNNLFSHSRKASMDNTAKQEYREWARNSPVPFAGKKTADPSDKVIYPSRAVLTSK